MNDKKKTVTYEVILSGDHPDIFVCFEENEGISDTDIQCCAEAEAFRKTYISSKRVLPLPNVKGDL